MAGSTASLQLALEIRVVALEAFEATLDFGLQLKRSRTDLLVGEFLHLRLERIDGFHDRLDALDVALVLRADEALRLRYL